MQMCEHSEKGKTKEKKQRGKEDYHKRRNIFKKLVDYMKGNKNSYLKKQYRTEILLKM